MEKKEKKRLVVRIDKDKLVSLKREAIRKDTSVSQLVLKKLFPKKEE